MAPYIEVGYDVIDTLFSVLEYAIARLEKAEDTHSAEYVREQLEEVRAKVLNGRFGGGDTTCGVIDRILLELVDEDG